MRWCCMQRILTFGQVFIMKDSWRDDDRRLEGEFYQRIGPAPGIATMRSYGIVYVDGEADIVASRIRRGLTVHAKPRSINEAQRKLRTQLMPSSTPEKSWGSTTDYTIFADILPFKDVQARTPRSKRHSRLVLETYGWPLKMALSPLEIVQAMQDVVMGECSERYSIDVSQFLCRASGCVRAWSVA